MGAVGDGIPGAVLTEIEEAFVEESVVFGFNEATETKIPQETSDTSYHVLTTKDDPDWIEFAMLAPAAANMLLVMGGTVTIDKWEAPSSIPEISQTVLVTTKTIDSKYFEYTIVNGKVVGRLSQAPGKKKSEIVTVRVYIQAAITALGVENTPFIREIK